MNSAAAAAAAAPRNAALLHDLRPIPLGATSANVADAPKDRTRARPWYGRVCVCLLLSVGGLAVALMLLLTAEDAAEDAADSTRKSTSVAPSAPSAGQPPSRWPMSVPVPRVAPVPGVNDLTEYACFALKRHPGVLALVYNDLVQLIGRQVKPAAIDTAAMRDAIASILPGDATWERIDIRDTQTSVRVCVGENNDAYADDLLDVMLASDFAQRLSDAMGVSGLAIDDTPYLRLTASLAPPPPPPPPPPPHILVTIHGGTENPEDDVAEDIAVWAGVPTAMQFAAGHQVNQFDYVYWSTVAREGCTAPPVVSDLSGFLDAGLWTAFTLPAGIYHLCLRQGTTIKHHPRVRVIANFRPAS